MGISGSPSGQLTAAFPLTPFLFPPTSSQPLTLHPTSSRPRPPQGNLLIKLPGSIQGQVFVVDTCTECEIGLFDHSDSVQVDDCSNCRIIIGECALFFSRYTTSVHVVSYSPKGVTSNRNYSSRQLLLFSRSAPLTLSTPALSISS
jgi:hypothetical protein